MKLIHVNALLLSDDDENLENDTCLLATLKAVLIKILLKLRVGQVSSPDISGQVFQRKFSIYSIYTMLLRLIHQTEGAV